MNTIKHLTGPDLCEELKQHIFTLDSGIKMLHHKFVVGMYFDDPLSNDHNNKLLEGKTKNDIIYREKKDAVHFVFNHERAYRFQALEEIAHDVDYWKTKKKDYWKLVGDVWVDQENIYENLDGWHDILFHGDYNDTPNASHGMMDESDRKFYKSLPSEFMIYRGGVDQYAYSWTLDKEKAKWFANRYKNDYEVFEKKAKKKNVIAYNNSRGEKEIIYDYFA